MAKKILITLVVGMLVWVWWVYALFGLRGGTNMEEKIEEAEIVVQEHRDQLETLQSLSPDEEQYSDEAVQKLINDFASTFVWVGDWNIKDEQERDNRSVCAHIKKELIKALGETDDHIATFHCTAGGSIPFLDNIRKLALNLNLGLTGKGDAERLVKIVDGHRAMVLLHMSASHEPEDVVASEIDRGELKVVRETVSLEAELYLLSKPSEDDIKTAEEEAEVRDDKFYTEMLKQNLLEASQNAQTEREITEEETQTNS